MKRVLFVMLICLSVLNATDSKKGIEDLSSELRVLLSQEMGAVEKGMKDIFSNIISGDYEGVNEVALKIKNSFILKQKLTADQRKELHTKLSSEFIETDQGFHQDAGSLAEAADLEDLALMNFYYSKMTATCVKCHSTFATQRFSNF